MSGQGQRARRSAPHRPQAVQQPPPTTTLADVLWVAGRPSCFHAAQQPSPMTTLPSPKPHRIRPPGTPSANRPLPRNLPPTRPAPSSHPPLPSDGLPTYPNPPSANPPYLPRPHRVSGSILPLPQDPVKPPHCHPETSWGQRRRGTSFNPLLKVVPNPGHARPSPFPHALSYPLRR